MPRGLRRRFNLTLILVALSACVSRPTFQAGDEPPTSTYQVESKKTGDPGCAGMLNDYCMHLYSPEASGDLLIERAKPIQILQGDTKNQFSHSFFRYSQTKLRNRVHFPRDLQAALDRHSYFEQLDEYLHRKAADKMSVDEAIDSLLTRPIKAEE